MNVPLKRVTAKNFSWPVGWTLTTAEGETDGKGHYRQMVLQFRKGRKRYWMGVVGPMTMRVWM